MLLWVVGAGVAAAAILIVAGHLRPLFTPRYLTIFVPSLMLGLAVWARSLGAERAFVPVALVLSSGGLALNWAHDVSGSQPRIMTWEHASEAAMKAGAKNLAFTWDNPSVSGPAPEHLGELGAFFFRRAAYAADVTGVILKPGDNPNERLAASASMPDSAIIWVYDLDVAGTAARVHPPELGGVGSPFKCHDYGARHIGVLLCLKVTPRQRL